MIDVASFHERLRRLLALTALDDVLIDGRRRTCLEGAVWASHAQVPIRSDMNIPINPSRQARKVTGMRARAAGRPREVHTEEDRLRRRVTRHVEHSAECWHQQACARSARAATRAAMEGHALPGIKEACVWAQLLTLICPTALLAQL